ncbi:hypothetical protein FIBSPDRAFT_1053823 [Athelia psychrophila]|uniref:Uncharacterized protein n=1 Tax=Athelia psychrophila TaxID=1759441 RepID=A0A167WBU4_9AGAM|nr:hypothetical protein FIBSPDRAFT_1053823 [Fibularhizoctonia sp. CBS 109695]
MHFSALTVLACALVAVTAHPVDNVANVVAPVKAENIGNKNTLGVANHILNHPKRHDGSVVNVVAPVKAENILNGNNVKAPNHIPRDPVNVEAPITLTDILNCNNINIANDILNHLASELGCTLAQLGINAQDLVGANPQNAPALLAKLSAAVQKVTQGKRDAVAVWAPITITDVLNCNTVKIANDLLNRIALHLGCTVEALGVTVAELLGADHDSAGAILAKLTAHGKRDVVAAWAPITIEDLLNCNNVEIANNILEDVAAHFGCTIEALGVTVAELLGANRGNAGALLAKLNAHAKRDAVAVWAPITIENILNCNTVEIANNLLNRLALHLGITVKEIGVTVAELLGANRGNADAILAKLTAHGKRDAVGVYAPITLKDILNCNTIKIANDLLNHLVLELKCTLAELGVTAEQLVGAKGDRAKVVLATLQAAIAKVQAHGKRGAVDAKAPVDVQNVANYNMVDVLNNVGNAHGGKRGLANVKVPIEISDVLNDNVIEILNNIANHGHYKRGAADVTAPVTASNIANYNMVDVLNNVGNSKGDKRNVATVVAPVKVEYVLNHNDVKAANNIANHKGGKRALADVVTGLKVDHVLDDNTVHVLNDVADHLD